jgi:hypothetical protein
LVLQKVESIRQYPGVAVDHPGAAVDPGPVSVGEGYKEQLFAGQDLPDEFVSDLGSGRSRGAAGIAGTAAGQACRQEREKVSTPHSCFQLKPTTGRALINDES